MNVVRERLRNQHIDGPPLKDPTDVVRWLVASQAQDFAGAKWALGLRTAGGADDAAVERAFNDGAILRTHVMRPTWHFITPADIRWMLALTAPRVHALNGTQYRALGLEAATLTKATAVVSRALAGRRQLTRDELRAALASAKIEADGLRMAYILMHAELDAVICSGPRRGKQFTYALLEERVPPAPARSRDQALSELAGRYFASRGPATVHDFAKWSGLTVADARSGLEAVASRLRSHVVNNATYWSAGPAARAAPRTPTAHLLSIYDEYISSYRDRSDIGDPAMAKKLVGMGNALAYVLLVNGKIAGTWKRSIVKHTVAIQMTPLRTLSASEQRAVAAAATRLTQFIGAKHVLDLDIRAVSR